MKILVSYRAIPQSPGWATGDLCVSALRKLGIDAHPYAKVYGLNRWLEDPKNLLNQSWDLVLFLECNDGDPQYNELLGFTNTLKKISWFFDSAMYPNYYYSLIHHFDENYCANMNMCDGSKIKFMPYAACSEKHFRPLEFDKKDIDLLIIGSDRPERERLYNMLLGDNFNVVYETNKFREDYINTLSRSKITVNDIAGGGDGLLPMRFFEATAAGSLLLTPKNQGGEQFSISVTYDGYNALKEKCSEYLCDQQKMNTQIMLTQNEVIKNHTYIKRMQQICQLDKI